MLAEPSDRKLTIQEVTFFLQEEFRRHESDKFSWEKEREVILGRVEYLREAASQHEGVVCMLEKRITMLESALQRERNTTQRSSFFTSPPPTDRLTSYALTDPAAFEDSPGASKENEPPPQSFSSHKRFSPGFSPLGRRQRKREQANEQAPAGEQPLSSRQKTAQRSLMFGGAEAEAPVSDTPRDPQGPAKLPDSPMPIPGPEGGVTSATVVPLPSTTRAASHKNRALSREQRRQRESAALSGSSAAPSADSIQSSNLSTGLLDTPRTHSRPTAPAESEPKPSKPRPSETATASSPAASGGAASIELPEDGTFVAEGIHGHLNHLGDDLEDSENEGDTRVVLAPLQGVVLSSPGCGMTSPKSQAFKHLKVDQLAQDASKMVLGEDSDSMATSQSTTPTNSPAQVRITA